MIHKEFPRLKIWPTNKISEVWNRENGNCIFSWQCDCDTRPGSICKDVPFAGITSSKGIVDATRIQSLGLKAKNGQDKMAGSHITFCANNLQSEDDMIGVIVHEFQHVHDHCYGGQFKDNAASCVDENLPCNCARSLCGEMRAYHHQHPGTDATTLFYRRVKKYFRLLPHDVFCDSLTTDTQLTEVLNNILVQCDLENAFLPLPPDIRNRLRKLPPYSPTKQQ